VLRAARASEVELLAVSPSLPELDSVLDLAGCGSSVGVPHAEAITNTAATRQDEATDVGETFMVVLGFSLRVVCRETGVESSCAVQPMPAFGPPFEVDEEPQGSPSFSEFDGGHGASCYRTFVNFMSLLTVNTVY
jgi:hypothetical protein